MPMNEKTRAQYDEVVALFMKNAEAAMTATNFSEANTALGMAVNALSNVQIFEQAGKGKPDESPRQGIAGVDE